MKKIMITAMVCISVAAFAKKWIITTTCGKTATLETSDDVSNTQMTQYMTVINYDLCSTIPKTFVINP